MSRRLQVVARKIKNTLQANQQVSVWLARWVESNFRSQGGKVGRWAPFKYGGRRMKKGKINKNALLLQDTGALKASFLPFFTRRVAGIRSGLRYAKFHEFGVPSRNLPARRMLPLHTDKEVMAGIRKIYEWHVKKATT